MRRKADWRLSLTRSNFSPTTKGEEAGKGESQQTGRGGFRHHGHAEDGAAGGAGVEGGVDLVGVAELDTAGVIRRKQTVVYAVVTEGAVGIDDIVTFRGGGKKGGDVEIEAIHIKATQIGGRVDREEAGAEGGIVEKEADGVGCRKGADERRAS